MASYVNTALTVQQHLCCSQHREPDTKCLSAVPAQCSASILQDRASILTR